MYVEADYRELSGDSAPSFGILEILHLSRTGRWTPEPEPVITEREAEQRHNLEVLLSPESDAAGYVTFTRTRECDFWHYIWS